MFGFGRSKKTPQEIIKDLENLNYFKYIPQESLSEYKSCLIENIEGGWLDFPSQMLIDLRNKRHIQREKRNCIDLRSINVNGESLFRGGLESTLADFVPLFHSRNLKLEVSDNNEIYSNNNENLKHQIKLNNNDYLIFDGKMQRGGSEVKYLKTVFKALNDELKNQSYHSEQFVPLTSIETIYFLLIDSDISNYIKKLKVK